MVRNMFQRIVLFLIILTLISCQKELTCLNCAESNQSPVANAGTDQITKLPKDSVLLDGENSSDADGTIKVWQWSKISGSTSIISNSSSSKTIAKGLISGIYLFELKVIDDGGLSAIDTVQIIVYNPIINQPPLANAGGDQKVHLPFSDIILDGSESMDPEKDIIKYHWTKISGPMFSSITTPNNIKTEVTSLVEGVYQFELKITDGGRLDSKDTVEVTVMPDPTLECDVNTRPIINATLTEIGKLSEQRIPSVGAAGNKIVFAGGVNDFICGVDYYLSSDVVDIYDDKMQTWSIAKLSQARHSITVASSSNKIFFAGGIDWKVFPGEGSWYEHFTNIDIYDAVNNTWTVAHLSKARINITAVTIGSKVIFAGGTHYIGNQTPVESNVVDIFDLSTNSWTAATLSVPRWAMSSIVIGDKAYFVGGTSQSGPVSAVDIYNARTNTWTTSTLVEDIALSKSYQIGNFLIWSELQQVRIKNIASGLIRSNCVSGAVSNYSGLKNDNLVFFTGSNPNAELIRFDILNTATGDWNIGKLNRSFEGTAFASVITVSDKLYLAGGASGKDECNTIFHDKVYWLSW